MFCSHTTDQSPKTIYFPLTGNTDEAPEHLPPRRGFSSGAGNACPALGSRRCWKRQWRQLPSVVARATQSWTLRAFSPAGKAKTKQNTGAARFASWKFSRQSHRATGKITFISTEILSPQSWHGRGISAQL